MRIVVTGGCGFIGSNFIRHLVQERPEAEILNLDALTYAANPLSLAGLETNPRYHFARVDLGEFGPTQSVIRAFAPTHVVHFAAESHVDRSISGPLPFARSNMLGTANLIEAVRGLDAGVRFHHISTDEVFGSLTDEGKFSENTPYDPSSPYSASKAASDFWVRAYAHTFGMDVVITNCSNNYGPYQFPEKLIPLMILNAVASKPLPVYGAGTNVRDWLYVQDHCEAILTVLERGKSGETYCVGGDSEMSNLDVVHAICHEVARQTVKEAEELTQLIQFVPDRPGHDYRYAINASKLKSELGWAPKHSFENGLQETVRFYLEQTEWVNSVTSGAYREWIARHYGS